MLQENPDISPKGNKTYKTYMEDVVSSDMKQNPKQFWSFIKSKRQDSTGVSSLIDKNGYLHSEGPMKAEFLNEQFNAAYIRGDTSVLPDKGNSPYPTMKRIQVHRDDLLKLLKDFKPHKASGPDGITARILILAADQLALVLAAISQPSLDVGELPTRQGKIGKGQPKVRCPLLVLCGRS